MSMSSTEHPGPGGELHPKQRVTNLQTEVRRYSGRFVSEADIAAVLLTIDASPKARALTKATDRESDR